MSRQLHLLVNSNAGWGGHQARWRVGDPTRFQSIDHYVEVARIAERGTFDAIFLSDHIGLQEDRAALEPWHVLDPSLALAAIARETSHIGLIATLSTTFSEPYEIARRVASLDLMSGGRSGWNIVTTAVSFTARNFNLPGGIPPSPARYARAEEFVDVVTALWDSWEPDAIVADRESGRFVDMSKVHRIDHAGEHFTVRGPLQVPRSPQGRPVLIQAGTSTEGRRLASRVAEGIFVIESDFEHARVRYGRIKEDAAAFGRDPEQILVLPGVYPIVGSTEEEAYRNRAELDQYLNMEREVELVADRMGVVLTVEDLDSPLGGVLERRRPAGEWPVGLFDNVWRLARANDRLTLREFILSAGAGHRQIVGAPEQIADDFERWFRSRACDGFNVAFTHFPGPLADFVEHVVPELRRRGIYRHEYEGTTLREHLGLEVPAGSHVSAAASGASR